jgi:ADP-ribose pyrophosphatase
MAFEIRKSQNIYNGPIFTLRQDHVTLPNGRPMKIDVIEHNNAVTIIPMDENGNIWFVRQYRHPTKQELLELPAGVIEPNESPETSANREIREEIGMRANKLEKVGGFYLAPGYSTEYMHIFLATALSPAPLPGDEDEFISIQKIKADEALKMAEGGEFIDAKSLIALFWMRPFLQKVKQVEG